MTRIIFLSLVSLSLLSCNINENRAKANNSIEQLSDEFIYRLCDSIIEHQAELEHVWNFNEVDSGSIERHELNLLDSIEGEQVITIKGFTGCSSGCSGHLLLVFDADDQLLQASQLPIDLTFVDFNRDGKSELLIHNLIMWMGECREYHSLFDLESDLIYFYRSGNSPETCGLSEEDAYVGDTLLNTFDLQLLDVNDDKRDEIILTTKIRTVQDSTLKIEVDTIQISEEGVQQGL